MNLFRKKNKGLQLYLHKRRYGVYSDTTIIKKRSKERLLNYFKSRKLRKNDMVCIEPFYNGCYYPMFDLDDLEKLELFKDIFSNEPYILFQTSPKHYWAFIDKSYENFQDIKELTNWHVCNDKNFVESSLIEKRLFIRGLYDSTDRKPKIIFRNKFDFSKNFINFVNDLESWYKNTALELSALLYRDKDLLLLYNRKKKLKNINETERITIP